VVEVNFRPVLQVHVTQLLNFLKWFQHDFHIASYVYCYHQGTCELNFDDIVMIAAKHHFPYLVKLTTAHDGPCHLHFKTTTFDDKKRPFSRHL
jgi:hypothetical protein